MADEEKKVVQEETPETAQQTASDSDASEELTNNHIAEKRGRMVAAGVVTAVILAVIAVVVAAVFQLTSQWLIQCPEDIAVNDPAPKLWEQLTDKQVVPQALGTPSRVAQEASFKGLQSPPAVPDLSSEDAKASGDTSKEPSEEAK
jgi:hypothetical protein